MRHEFLHAAVLAAFPVAALSGCSEPLEFADWTTTALVTRPLSWCAIASSSRSRDRTMRPALGTSLVVLVVLLQLAASGCSPGPDGDSADGTWMGTVTTEGDVTTVRNESGSVWGGTATLVEEASIGMADGPEEQLFGFPAGVGMTMDRIFVLDGQLRMIRSYDENGNHLADCGGPGQGPAELESSLLLELGTSADGRVFAHAGSEIEVFSADCEPIATLTVPRAAMTLASPMVVSDEGIPYLSFPIDREGFPTEWTYGMQAYGPDGPEGEPIPQPAFDFEREELELRQRMNSGEVAITHSSPPYAPSLVWGMMPSGATVGGVSSRDRFEITHPDGLRTVVENSGAPARLSGDEADWYGRRFVALLHGERIVDAPSWSASELPEVKPAFYRFLPDRSGRLWVLRVGEGERLADCNEAARTYAEFFESPCWQDPTLADVFAGDGRYLGRVDVPAQMRWSPPPYIRDDVVVAVAEDEEGTIMVKRYRLVLPGEAGPAGDELR